ncbi:MAG: ABC-three component system protein [Burkholderiaceae bacterium]
MVEGWWFKRVIHELVHGGTGIPRAEIDAQISDIQESLKRDSLPIDGQIDTLMVALEQLPEFANRPFYRQVELVGAGPLRIRNAITSYLQAFRQRSAWTRDDLLFDAELRQYDQRLLSEKWLRSSEQLSPIYKWTSKGTRWRPTRETQRPPRNVPRHARFARSLT